MTSCKYFGAGLPISLCFLARSRAGIVQPLSEFCSIDTGRLQIAANIFQLQFFIRVQPGGQVAHFLEQSLYVFLGHPLLPYRLLFLQYSHETA